MYLSIPTIEDDEIVNTVSSAILHADRPDISVGVAFMTGKEFYKNKSSEIKKLSPKVDCRWFDPAKNRGVGVGRKNAKFAYNNEEMFLQIDSHTNFEPSWDTTILSLYDESAAIGTKRVMTAYLGKYSTKSDTRTILDRRTRYSWFTENHEFYEVANFTLWQPFPIREIMADRGRFVPANKFNANFALGDYRFANSHALPETAAFFDEEIIQSVNLMSEGFFLVFPNVDLPLTHLYGMHEGHKNKRQTVQDIDRDVINNMRASYLNFVNDPNNRDKCREYQQYARYGMWDNRFEPFFIPLDYF